MEKKLNKYELIFNLIWFQAVTFSVIYLSDKYNWRLALTAATIFAFEMLRVCLFRKVAKISY